MSEPDDGSADTSGNPRRTSFAATLALGLSGSALATVGATQSWASATTRSPAVRTVIAEGTDVTPGALPLALVALAAWGTVLVLRRRGRRVVAVVGLLAASVAGGAVLASAHTAPEVAARLLGDGSEVSMETTAWPVATAVGCMVAAAAFVVALLKAPSWPEMSARYDAPGEHAAAARRGPMTDTELWKALDEGHDPTVADGPGSDKNP